jgi:hypothetical protein
MGLHMKKNRRNARIRETLHKGGQEREREIETAQ